MSFSIAHPGLGPRRVASELAREKWGGIIVSPNGVWKVLCRHGLNTRAKRLGLIAGYAAPYEPPRTPEPERHIDVERPTNLTLERQQPAKPGGEGGFIDYLRERDILYRQSKWVHQHDLV